MGPSPVGSDVRSTTIRFVSCRVLRRPGGFLGFRRASLGQRKAVIRRTNNLKKCGLETEAHREISSRWSRWCRKWLVGLPWVR